MAKDKAIGALIFLAAIAVGCLYAYGILYHLVLTVVAIMSLGVAFVLFIFAWLGVEMMRTPSLEEFEKEVEVEEKKEEKPKKRKKK